MVEWISKDITTDCFHPAPSLDANFFPVMDADYDELTGYPLYAHSNWMNTCNPFITYDRLQGDFVINIDFEVKALIPLP
jgi:hypothetical protein